MQDLSWLGMRLPWSVAYCVCSQNMGVRTCIVSELLVGRGRTLPYSVSSWKLPKACVAQVFVLTVPAVESPVRNVWELVALAIIHIHGSLSRQATDVL